MNIIIPNDTNDTNDKDRNKLQDYSSQDSLVKASFYFTYAFLMTTGTVTFIEALRTKNEVVRHIMNIETCISIVAAFFYSQFLEKLKESEGKEIPYESINLTRYTDWVVTTPLMLLVLCMVLSLENKKVLTISKYLLIIFLNFGMLSFGYMGEINQIDKLVGLIIGFIFFFMIFWVIWKTFMNNTTTIPSKITYFAFLILWSIYGVIYLADDKTKNIVFNILDVTAKGFVGLFFWLYFTKALAF
jgi:bacteriorhodopsin